MKYDSSKEKEIECNRNEIYEEYICVIYHDLLDHALDSSSSTITLLEVRLGTAESSHTSHTPIPMLKGEINCSLSVKNP